MRFAALAVLLLCAQGALAQSEAPPLVQRDLGKSPTTAPAVDGPTLTKQAQDLERAGQGPEAVKLYIRAARSGDGKAAARLADIYRKGIPGVPANAGEAQKWTNAARVLGEPPMQIAPR